MSYHSKYASKQIFEANDQLSGTINLRQYRIRTHWTDKICLALPKISTKFLNVGALRHSKIFVNHKCQSHGNKHHRFSAVRGKGYMRSQESWAYDDL